MIWDWLIREGWIVLSWWALVTLAGVAVLPLCWRLLSALPEKGYTLSRVIGILLVSFVFWLLATLGFLKNTTGSMIFAWLVVLTLSLIVYFNAGERLNLRAWVQENSAVIITGEILFFALLFGWALVRAYQNGITGTEKPMDLMFISSITRSDTFPPNDGWMSGYAISYYYFGYVQAAMLSTLSGIPTTIGYNMTTAMIVALTGLTSFGVGYNLVRSQVSGLPPILTGLLAMLFVVFLGNFQVSLIEVPFEARSLPEGYFDFWGTQERTNFQGTYYQEDGPFYRDIAQWPSWWWFRASRVLQDFQLDGSLPPEWHAQPIDEFPQFSFLLADNHPHVMALPFAVMMIGLALNALLVWRNPTRIETLLYGICIGGLFFLNTWDGPIYLALLIGVECLRRLMQSEDTRLSFNDLIALAKFGLFLIAIAIIPYLPFWISFRSQAAGFLPNLLYPTQFQQYFIMFGPFIIILSLFLVLEVWRGHRDYRMNWRFGIGWAGIILAGLVVIMAILTLLGTLIPNWQTAINPFVEQNGGWANILPGFVRRRIGYALTTVVLVLAIAVILARLFPRIGIRKHIDTTSPITYPATTGFALILVALGVMLSLVPEFFYLRDNFSTRINTIFKFYYQAWILFGIASAYAIYSFFADNRAARPDLVFRVIGSGAFSIAIFMGMIYPIFGIFHRTQIEPSGAARLYNMPPDWGWSYLQVNDGQFVHTGDLLISEAEDALAGRTLTAQADGQVLIREGLVYVQPAITLDGGPTMVMPDDYAVVMCLNDLVRGDDVVIAEAVRDAYNAWYGRVASITGMPIILGWENHERQWRGATYDIAAGSRRFDMDEFYSDLRWDVAVQIIDRYDIDYIMFGATERQQYSSAGEQKFMDNLDIVCESGESRVYSVGKALRTN